MTDQELLEKAAKASGIKIDKSEVNGGGRGNTGFDMMGNAVLDWHNHKKWNPLTDDGDALRLAVKLQITLTPGDIKCAAQWWVRPGMIILASVVELAGGDPFAASRRAIVRAAAAISDAA